MIFNIPHIILVDREYNFGHSQLVLNTLSIGWSEMICFILLDAYSHHLTFVSDPYPLNWQLIPGGTDGTVMQLYEYGDEKSLQVTFYEFEDDETLQFKCGLLHFIQGGPVLYLELKASSGCKYYYLSQTHEPFIVTINFQPTILSYNQTFYSAFL